MSSAIKHGIDRILGREFYYYHAPMFPITDDPKKQKYHPPQKIYGKPGGMLTRPLTARELKLAGLSKE